MAPSEKLVLFLWGFSPWASKVVAYLALRKIPYERCEQPIYHPRPDLAALGINYRRIPVLSIGRDFYADTLLIIQKLEKLFPPSAEHPSISAEAPLEVAVERLFEKWTDVVVFKPAAACIPSDMELLADPGFQKDREELWGRPWTKDAQDALRPAGLADMRVFFDLLEKSLTDGHKFLLGNDIKLADIHAAWIFDWMLSLPTAMPQKYFNKTKYPKTIAWREAYAAAVEAGKQAAPKPTPLEGPAAVAQILAAGFNEPESELEVLDDPEDLKLGQEVEMFPSDTGFDRRDRGKLVALNTDEAVIKSVSKQDGREIRIHYPRWNFEIKPVA